MNFKNAPEVPLHVGKVHAAHTQLMHSKPQPSGPFLTAALYLFVATPSVLLHSDYHVMCCISKHMVLNQNYVLAH